MTTICWDGKALAGDRRNHIGNTPLPPMRKVFRMTAPNGRKALFGFTGSVAYMRKYLHWLTTMEKPEHQPGDDMKFTVLAIDDTGTVWFRCETTNVWDNLGRTLWAVGSGCDYALGAMKAGKSARDAVLIASQLDLQTGDGVDVVSF